jgi:hypothetical protein
MYDLLFYVKIRLMVDSRMPEDIEFKNKVTVVGFNH